MNSSTARTWNKNDGRMLPINLLSGSCWDMFLTLLCLTCPEIPITYSEGAGLSHINQNQANAPQICSQANLIREISKLRPSQITQDWVKLVVEANQRGGSSLRGWIWPSNALPMSEKKAPSFTKGKVHYTPLFYALSVSLDGGTPCRQGGCDVASVPDTSTSSCHSSPLLVPLSHIISPLSLEIQPCTICCFRMTIPTWRMAVTYSIREAMFHQAEMTVPQSFSWIGRIFLFVCFFLHTQ